MRKNKKGFTLIEIIVVVVVLAVLMAVAVPSVLKYIHEADDAKVYTVVRTYMNDIEIAKAKAMIDDQDKTSLTWEQFEKDIANYLAQEKLFAQSFGSVGNVGVPDDDPNLGFVEGYFITFVGYTAENGSTTVDYSLDNYSTNLDVENTYVDFLNGVNFTEYKFVLYDKSGTMYKISCVPNGKITILDKQ